MVNNESCSVNFEQVHGEQFQNPNTARSYTNQGNRNALSHESVRRQGYKRIKINNYVGRSAAVNFIKERILKNGPCCVKRQCIAFFDDESEERISLLNQIWATREQVQHSSRHIERSTFLEYFVMTQFKVNVHAVSGSKTLKPMLFNFEICQRGFIFLLDISNEKYQNVLSKVIETGSNESAYAIARKGDRKRSDSNISFKRI